MCFFFLKRIFYNKTSLSVRSYSLASQKVAMSNFEKDKYINYQRIEDNLKVVRKRYINKYALTYS